MSPKRILAHLALLAAGLSLVKQLFLSTHTQHYPRLPVIHLGSISFAAVRARFGCVITKGGSASSVCLEVAVWTCGAPAEPCVEPPPRLPPTPLPVPALRRFAGVRRIPGLEGTDGELGFGFPDMIPV